MGGAKRWWWLGLLAAFWCAAACETEVGGTRIDTGTNGAEVLVAPDVAGGADATAEVAAPPCAALSQEACVASAVCVLELGALPYTYVCRDAAPGCERRATEVACAGDPSCVWIVAPCYCPEAFSCECAGGSAPICRHGNDPVSCRPAPEGDDWCPGAAVCCAGGDDALGACREGGCEVACGGMQRDDCIASETCFLELGEGPEGYVCRDAANDCERLTSSPACSAAEGCGWQSGACYCPDGLDCYCGGGPPPGCRDTTTPLACRPAYGQLDCPADLDCCAGPVDGVGECRATGTCERLPDTGCRPLVKVRSDGGLCMYGACYTEILVREDGYLFADDETSFSPREATLEAATLEELGTLLAAIDVPGLADGYGDCCNAWADGSDTYVHFYDEAGAPLRIVRISRNDEAPAALIDLVSAVSTRGRGLLGAGDASAAPCPGLFELPAYDVLPEPSCESTPVLVRNAYVWQILGPRNQRFDREVIRVEALGESPALPATLTLEGTATGLEPGNALTLTTDEGEDWRLTFTARPTNVPMFCAVIGQRLRLSAHVAWAFEIYIHGLVVSDDRGVLFVTDEGLSGVAALPEVPFSVEAAATLCPQDEGPDLCAPAGAQELVFTAGEQELALLTGAWARLALPGARDLALLNLRSYSSGLCDDYWNYAYVGFALAGSDAPSCD